jgi:hypothetical protein
MPELRFATGKLLGGVAIYFCMATMAHAQLDFGSITGFVKDPSGAVVTKAKVTIQNEGTGLQRPTDTNDSGYYVMTNLPPGYYSVTAEASGFKKFLSEHNQLQPNSTLSVDIALTVGAASESVQVTADLVALQTESASVQQEVNGKQVLDQELNGRNPIYMVQLLPGVLSKGTSLGDLNFGSTGGQTWQINGARTWDTLVTFDGAPAVRTRANGAVIGSADVESTQEMQVLTADYAAEYGRAAGGQIRIVTKSGTRDYHGSLYEYFRNSDLNANTWSRNLSTTTNFTTPFRYNNFGGTFGGPIIPKGKWRDRLFFFVAEDWIRDRNTDTNIQSVPTTLMRTGNFSELLSPNPFYSGSHVIYQPSSCPTLGAASCVPYPNNIIPASQLSHNGIAIIDAYPAPTPGYLQGANNLIQQAAHPYNQRKDVLSIDLNVTDNQRISGRKSGAQYFEYQPFDQNSGETGKYFNRPNQTNTVSYTYTISPTVINEARITFSLDDVYIPVNTSLPGFNRSQFGIDYPYIFGGKDIPGKIPTINMPNFLTLAGGPYPSHSSGPIWTGGDSVTKIWGNHTFKAGIAFEYSGENDGDQINVSTVPGGSNNQNGTFTFTDARTGLGATSGIGMANLALGLADSYTEIGPRALTIWRGLMFEEFAQDSWKVTQKLHVDYGVRITTIQGYHPLWGNADYFDGGLYNPAQAPQVDPKTGNVILGTGNPYDGVVIPGFSTFPSSAMGRVLAATSNICDNASCSGLFAPNMSKSYIGLQSPIQPRVGLAYQLTPTTVLRAGLGRFVTRMGLIDNIFPGGNSPFQPFVTVTNPSVDNPPAALTSGTAAPLTITTLNPHLKPPEAWNWNATVQRQLPGDTLLSVAYVAHRGLHAWGVYDINEPTAGALLANPGVSANYLRPYKGYAAIQEEESVVNSMYNSLQISLNRAFKNGLLLSFSYTLSKSMDGGSNYRDIYPDTYNTSNMWGPSEYDSRHAVFISYIYQLPFFKNHNQLSGKLLGGWELAGSMQFETGNPCGIGTNNDFAGVGEYGSFGCGSEGQFWVLNGPVTINSGAFAGPVTTSSSPKYFSVNATQPPAGTFNTQSGVRDSVYQPGIQDWNIGLIKAFPVTERTALQFRAEAYDFINHPNLSAPNLNPSSGQFGMITGKTTLARNMQLSLRLQF